VAAVELKKKSEQLLSLYRTLYKRPNLPTIVS